MDIHQEMFIFKEDEMGGNHSTRGFSLLYVMYFVILFSSGEYVFMDSSSPTVVSNQILSSGATRTCKEIDDTCSI